MSHLLLQEQIRILPRAAKILVLALLICISVVTPVSAVVTSPYGTVSASDIDSIPWEYSIQNHNPSLASPLDSVFDINDPDLSLVIMTVHGGSSSSNDWQDYNYYLAYVHGPTNKLKLEKYTDVLGNTRYKVVATGAGYYFTGTIVTPTALDYYKADNAGACPWGTCGSQADKLEGYVNLNRYSYSGDQAVAVNNYLVPPTAGIPKDIARGKNLTFTTNYDGTRAFNSDLKSGANPESCDTWDVACKIRNVFSGIGDSIRDSFKAMMGWFVGLFQPDTLLIADQFEELQTELSNQFGFLGEAVVFPVTLFTSFLTEHSWCSTSSCSISGGDLFGGDFGLSLNSFFQKFPALWTWASMFIRGLVVIGLIFAFRRKILKLIGDDE